LLFDIYISIFFLYIMSYVTSDDEIE